jgi:hypothetical protein
MLKRVFTSVSSSDEEDKALRSEGGDEKLSVKDKDNLTSSEDDEASLVYRDIFNLAQTPTNLQLPTSNSNNAKPSNDIPTKTNMGGKKNQTLTDKQKPTKRTSAVRSRADGSTRAATKPPPNTRRENSTVSKRSLNEYQKEWSETTYSKTNRLLLYSEVLKPENFCRKFFVLKSTEPQNDCTASFFKVPCIFDPVREFNTNHEITRVLYMSPEQCLAASDRLCRLSDQEYSETFAKIHDKHFLQKAHYGNSLAEVPKILLNSDFSAYYQEGAHRIIAARVIHNCSLIPIAVTFKLTEKQAEDFRQGILKKFTQDAMIKQLSSFSLSEGELYQVAKLWRG